jgi:hypothetical protein
MWLKACLAESSVARMKSRRSKPRKRLPGPRPLPPRLPPGSRVAIRRSRDTSLFLKRQAQLLQIQAEHLEEEHALRLAHLRNQLREENVRRFGLRLRVSFQLFLVLVATVIAGRPSRS